ncbi:MAG: hypothetical protein R2911_45560 [Caldilineaceae bacterium]
MIYLGFMGVGMGCSVSPFLDRRAERGAQARHGRFATSTLQFSRNIGGTLGVSVMGAILSIAAGRLAHRRRLDPSSVSLDSLIDSLARSDAAAALDSTLRGIGWGHSERFHCGFL